MYIGVDVGTTSLKAALFNAGGGGRSSKIRMSGSNIYFVLSLVLPRRVIWRGAPLPLEASHCLARMQWMAETHPDIWARTRHVLLPKDYCILKLTGAMISDPISHIGLDDLDLKHIPALLDIVAGAGDKLAPLAAMTDIAEEVKDGLPCAGVPVAVGTMDAWASMFGVGVHQPGQGFYLSGTSEVLGVICDTIIPTPGVLVFPKIGDITVHAGPTQSGGAFVSWYCTLLDTTPKAMAASVAALDFADTCPLFLPHLQGERAPPRPILPVRSMRALDFPPAGWVKLWPRPALNIRGCWGRPG